MQANNVQILVLDFGSQYTQLIARRLREFGVYTEIVPYFESIDSIKAKNPKGIILSGGPASVYEEGAYKPDNKVFELGIPVLGICYGMQYIAYHFGGAVVRAKEQEFGKAQLEILATDTALFANVKNNSVVWMSHADKVEKIPQGFSELAKSGNTHYCAIADTKRQIYALQFHPEVVHSECGGEILKNFAVNICRTDKSWNMKNFITYEIDKIRKITGIQASNSESNTKATSSNRCGWIYQGYNASDKATQKLYQDYHDFEWGIPQHDDKRLFEQLVLEGMQAGLSWITILKKREAFRAAFDAFDPHIVATYDEAKTESLLQDTGIIRNRAKIQATITNAQAFLRVQKEFGSFDKCLNNISIKLL